MANTVDVIFEEWESSGTISAPNIKRVEEIFELLMKVKLGEVETSVDADPHFAFAQLIALTSFLNAVATKRPSIIKRLGKWVKKLQAVANALAKKLGANGFSIGVQIPAGVSVDLSFPVT